VPRVIGKLLRWVAGRPTTPPSPHPPALRAARPALLLFGLALLAAQGCARVPDEVTGDQVRRRLTVSFSVAGQVNPQYFYFIAIDADGNPSSGPVPVVTAPFGNGWVTGSVTHYVEFHLGVFGVFRFVPDTNLLVADSLGSPFEFNQPQQPPGNRISATLDVDRTLGTDVNLINLNIITTDRIDIDPTFTGTKIFDALGASGNQFLTLPLNVTQTFTNAQSPDPETAGDLPPASSQGVDFSALDITDWTIQVQVRQ
jgi:hypothetical protein